LITTASSKPVTNYFTWAHDEGIQQWYLREESEAILYNWLDVSSQWGAVGTVVSIPVNEAEWMHNNAMRNDAMNEDEEL
jgi:hypothetical protein